MPDADLFDPAAHTVREVNAYLTDADPDEVARVLAAEAAAEEPRKGVLEGPHAVTVEDAEPPTFEEKLGDANPYELVRAKDIAGNEYTTSRVAALVAGSTVLDKPPLDGFGLPAPTKTVLDFRAEATTDAGEPSTEPTKE